MCGIFGGIKQVNLDKIKILGVLNESRGTDSTGIFDSKRTTKAVLPFNQFAVDYHLELKKHSNYIVGHTRFATTGKKSERNAHPFTFGKITGVHNGVISNFTELKKKYSVVKLECDSEIIFYLLNLKGVEGLTELKGYFAIVYRDQSQPEKIFALNHNSEFAYVKQNNAIYFSSDSDHLKTAFSDSVKIVEIKEDNLYTFDINTLEVSLYEVKNLQNSEWAVSSHTALNDKGHYELYKGTGDHYEGYPAFTNESGVLQDDETCPCPHCKFEISIEEIESGFCPFCYLELKGKVFTCDYCSSPHYVHDKTEPTKCNWCLFEISKNRPEGKSFSEAKLKPVKKDFKFLKGKGKQWSGKSKSRLN